MPPSLDLLSRPRAARWFQFEVYKDTGRKLNFSFIDKKGQWIFLREDLLDLKLAGFI